MTFLAQNDAVIWSTPGGPYELKDAAEIDAVLAIFDREHDRERWGALDQAAQHAGYPGSVSTLSRKV